MYLPTFPCISRLSLYWPSLLSGLMVCGFTRFTPFFKKDGMHDIHLAIELL